MDSKVKINGNDIKNFLVARGSDDWTLTFGGINDATVDSSDDGESKQLFYSGASGKLLF